MPDVTGTNSVNILMLWQPMKHTNIYNECHLKTALAFYTTVCMAGLHRDCMPFKKGQINIALLPHKNIAVVLFFSFLALFINILSYFEYFDVNTFSI